MHKASQINSSDKIDKLALNTKAYKALKKLGVYTVLNLLEQNLNAVMKLQGYGKSTYQYLIKKQNKLKKDLGIRKVSATAKKGKIKKEKIQKIRSGSAKLEFENGNHREFPDKNILQLTFRELLNINQQAHDAIFEKLDLIPLKTVEFDSIQWQEFRSYNIFKDDSFSLLYSMTIGYIHTVSASGVCFEEILDILLNQIELSCGIRYELPVAISIKIGPLFESVDDLFCKNAYLTTDLLPQELCNYFFEHGVYTVHYLSFFINDTEKRNILSYNHISRLSNLRWAVALHVHRHPSFHFDCHSIVPV